MAMACVGARMPEMATYHLFVAPRSGSTSPLQVQNTCEESHGHLAGLAHRDSLIPIFS